MWQFLKLIALLIAFLFVYNLDKRIDARGKDVIDAPVPAVPTSHPQGASEMRLRGSTR